MKKGRIISSMLVLIMASGFVLSGCGKADAKYFAKVSQYSFWDNQGAESIPQSQSFVPRLGWRPRGRDSKPVLRCKLL